MHDRRIASMAAIVDLPGVATWPVAADAPAIGAVEVAREPVGSASRQREVRGL